MPVAIEPLWQLEQVPETPAWLNCAVAQETVLWHCSQGWDVGRWLLGLPTAVEPLWQLAQEPVTPL
jgi:hypothetical protein